MVKQNPVVVAMMALIGVLLPFFATSSFTQQSKPLDACPLISLADAAVLTGPGVEFLSGREKIDSNGQKTYLCFFNVGQGRSLTVKSGPSLAKSGAEYRKMFEPLRKMDNMNLETGLGEYAYSKLDDGSAEITAVKGTTALTLELKGDDLTPADLDKMRAAVKKAVDKI